MENSDSVPTDRYRTTLVRSALATAPPDTEKPQGFTVWLAPSCAGWAIDIAERLQGLDIDVKLWDDTRRPAPIGDAAFLGSSVEARKPVWRGGLAPRALRRVKEHVELCLAEKIDLCDLARMVGLSDCHFARAFRQSVGVPPHRYIMTRRVAVAAKMLEQTGHSLTDIALAVGFSDQSHFTRTFVRLSGETPGACRRRHR